MNLKFRDGERLCFDPFKTFNLTSFSEERLFRTEFGRFKVAKAWLFDGDDNLSEKRKRREKKKVCQEKEKKPQEQIWKMLTHVAFVGSGLWYAAGMEVVE